MARATEIRLIPVPIVDEIVPGNDLVEKLRAALRHHKLSLTSGDVLVIKHKIISKAEGQIVRLADVRPCLIASTWARTSGTDPRLIELVFRESRRLVREQNN